MTQTTGTGTGTQADPTRPRTIVILLNDGQPCTVIVAHLSTAVLTPDGTLDLTQTPHTQLRVA